MSEISQQNTMATNDYKRPSAIKWNDVEKVGRPPAELRTYMNGPCSVPRTFLCKGEWSLFTSRMFDDGSGFEDEGDDPVKAWAVIDGF